MSWNEIRPITNTEDVIDSRDVIARIEYLWNIVRSEDEHQELMALQELADEASGYADDWCYGETLVRDDYFEDYARELAEDTGMVKGTEHWPLNCIDWEQAARELQIDYTSVDFDGVTYWIR